MCCCWFVIEIKAEGQKFLSSYICVCLCLVNFKESPQICAFLFPWRKLLIFHNEGCTWFRIWLSLLNLFFRRPNLAKLPAYMLEDETGLSPRLQTLAFPNVQCVTNLSTEPLKVVVKKATARMDVCNSGGVQVTSHNCVVGTNL